MAQGSSGRIVVEVDPLLKEQLYSALKKEGLTLKDWFLLNADQFLSNKSQMSLLPVDNNEARKAG